MVRKSIIVILFCALTAGLAAAVPTSEEPAPVSKKAGFALLDMYVDAFRSMATGGAKDALQDNLNTMISKAKKALTSGDVDKVFFARYNRLIAITKLITIKDPGKTAYPIFEYELQRFVMDTIGEKMQGEGPQGIGQMADALAFAIIDLQIYLETLDGRQSRYDKFVKSFNPEK